ncbi:protein translocase subunit SecF [soil metagenome]
MGRLSSFGQHLYEGRVSFDFVGQRKLWYAISALIVLAAGAGLLFRGVNLGVEFKGGVEFTAQIAPTQSNVDTLREAVVDAGVEAAGDPIVTTSGTDAVRIQTKPLDQPDATLIEQALTEAGATDVSQNLIGPSWGKQVANKALTGLVVFLVLVVLFIWAYFREWKMSVAAIVALAHDLLITVGVYAWSGFEVTPTTVTGLLTILGFSLYDTVVVFDKVRENTRNFAQNLTRTYSESANLAVNQTLVRSINTSVAALLPVAAILVISVVVLGTGPLKDLSLALFVGTAAGGYSSIFIATPLAVQLKDRETAVRTHAKRVLARRARSTQVVPETPVGEGEEAPPVGATAAVAGRGVAVSSAAKRSQPQRTPRSQRAKGK